MKFKLIASLLLLILLLAACSSSPAESVEIADIHDEMVALTESPAAVPIYLSPEASVRKSNPAVRLRLTTPTPTTATSW